MYTLQHCTKLRHASVQNWCIQYLFKVGLCNSYVNGGGNVCDTYAGFCSYRYAPVFYRQAYDVIDFIEKQVYLK